MLPLLGPGEPKAAAAPLAAAAQRPWHAGCWLHSGPAAQRPGCTAPRAHPRRALLQPCAAQHLGGLMVRRQAAGQCRLPLAQRVGRLRDARVARGRLRTDAGQSCGTLGLRRRQALLARGSEGGPCEQGWAPVESNRVGGVEPGGCGWSGASGDDGWCRPTAGGGAEQPSPADLEAAARAGGGRLLRLLALHLCRGSEAATTPALAQHLRYGTWSGREQGG